MGQRISIKVLDLLNAGCIVRQRIHYHPACEQFAAWEEKQLIATFVDKEVVLDFIVFEGVIIAEADYNDWGTLKPVLEPLLAAWEIPHEIM